MEIINEIDLNLQEAQWVSEIQHFLSSPSLDYFFLNITDLHKQLWFQLGIAFPLIVLWIWREQKEGVKKFFLMLLILLMVDGFCGQVIKKFFLRPRPFEILADVVQKSPASGFSFVSNHSANMMALSYFLSRYYPRFRLAWWSVAVAVSFSRIYNGVHFISDVLVGGLIGFTFSFLIIRWFDRKKVMGQS